MLYKDNIRQTGVDIRQLSFPLVRNEIQIENKNSSNLSKTEHFPINSSQGVTTRLRATKLSREIENTIETAVF